MIRTHRSGFIPLIPLFVVAAMAVVSVVVGTQVIKKTTEDRSRASSGSVGSGGCTCRTVTNCTNFDIIIHQCKPGYTTTSTVCDVCPVAPVKINTAPKAIPAQSAAPVNNPAPQNNTPSQQSQATAPKPQPTCAEQCKRFPSGEDRDGCVLGCQGGGKKIPTCQGTDSMCQGNSRYVCQNGAWVNSGNCSSTVFPTCAELKICPDGQKQQCNNGNPVCPLSTGVVQNGNTNTPLKVVNSGCTTNAQCSTGYCNSGVCQIVPIASSCDSQCSAVPASAKSSCLASCNYVAPKVTPPPQTPSQTECYRTSGTACVSIGLFDSCPVGSFGNSAACTTDTESKQCPTGSTYTASTHSCRCSSSARVTDFPLGGSLPDACNGVGKDCVPLQSGSCQAPFSCILRPDGKYRCDVTSNETAWKGGGNVGDECDTYKKKCVPPLNCLGGQADGSFRCGSTIPLSTGPECNPKDLSPCGAVSLVSGQVCVVNGDGKYRCGTSSNEAKWARVEGQECDGTTKICSNPLQCLRQADNSYTCVAPKVDQIADVCPIDSKISLCLCSGNKIAKPGTSCGGNDKIQLIQSSSKEYGPTTLTSYQKDGMVALPGPVEILNGKIIVNDFLGLRATAIALADGITTKNGMLTYDPTIAANNLIKDSSYYYKQSIEATARGLRGDYGGNPVPIFDQYAFTCTQQGLSPECVARAAVVTAAVEAPFAAPLIPAVAPAISSGLSSFSIANASAATGIPAAEVSGYIEALNAGIEYVGYAAKPLLARIIVGGAGLGATAKVAQTVVAGGVGALNFVPEAYQALQVVAGGADLIKNSTDLASSQGVAVPDLIAKPLSFFSCFTADNIVTGCAANQK